MKKSVILTAEVEQVVYTSGPMEIDVRYNYGGRSIHNSFHITHTLEDSLKKGMKVKLRVSEDYPEKYIEYMGIDR
jgi:hypothetical protein